MAKSTELMYCDQNNCNLSHISGYILLNNKLSYEVYMSGLYMWDEGLGGGGGGGGTQQVATYSMPGQT